MECHGHQMIIILSMTQRSEYVASSCICDVIPQRSSCDYAKYMCSPAVPGNEGRSQA